MPAALAIFLLLATGCQPDESGRRSIAENKIEWPGWRTLLHAATLPDYNTRVVVAGTVLLGVAAGVIGTFAYLRKRAMVGDALSHATLPGIAIVFLMTGEKNLVSLLLGAAASGVLGILCVIGLRRFPRIKEDAAIGIVLSVFFGAGMVLVRIAQDAISGNQSGFDRFIYGTTAGMILQDSIIIAISAACVLIISAAFFKEFRIVCFDEQFAASQGWPVLLIDILMMGLLVMTTVVGLQAVGLILVVALLIIPAAAARFWTDELVKMTTLAGLIGAVSGYVGSVLSATIENLPTGAVIVLCAGVFFFYSMFCAPHRGVIASWLRLRNLQNKVAYQNLLRALAEAEEQHGENAAVSFDALLAMRSWSRRGLRRILQKATGKHYDVTRDRHGNAKLTREGRIDARRILRNHRLWELYLIRYADIAPSHVDRDADHIEHVLAPETVHELERALEHQQESHIPPSPHVEGARP